MIIFKYFKKIPENAAKKRIKKYFRQKQEKSTREKIKPEKKYPFLDFVVKVFIQLLSDKCNFLKQKGVKTQMAAKKKKKK